MRFPFNSKSTSNAPNVAIVCALLCLAIGCNKSNGQTEPKRTAESSLRQIGVLYGQYVGRHKGKGPANEAEFRKYIQEHGQRGMKLAAASSVDELLTSPRDNEPFQVRYGIKPGPPGQSGGAVVAYEKTGAGGKRFVVDFLGKVSEVNQSELDEMLKN